MQYLRQSTAATVPVGPAVDATDGFTPETGLTAGTVDEIGVYKHDSTSLVSISGTTTFTHRAGGMYTTTFSTSDTNTLGRVTLYVRDDSVCRPIRQEYMVIDGDLYDNTIGGGGLYDKLIAGFGSTTESLHNHLTAIMDEDSTAPSDVGQYDPTSDSLEFIGSRIPLIEGSGFATGTDSLQKIRDSIDTLIAPVVVGASSLSGSGFLSDCVTLVRQMTDEPSLLPKYTDADVVELVTSAMTVVMSEIHNNSDHNIINRFDIQLVPGKQSYILPPNVGEVWAVRKMSTTTPISPIYEVWSDNHWSSHQSGFVIEYNEFRLLTDWRSNDILEMLYVPNGESFMHKATASSVGANTIIFPSSVTDGTLDTRANAYAGYLVRILSDTTGYVQEKVIDTYDNVIRKATLTTDWNPLPTGTIVYEVLPTFSNIIKHCVCLQAAMDVLSNEGNEKRLKTVTGRYLVKIRALRQMITKKSSRFPGHAIGDTSDNDQRGDYYGWLV